MEEKGFQHGHVPLKMPPHSLTGSHMCEHTCPLAESKGGGEETRGS